MIQPIIKITKIINKEGFDINKDNKLLAYPKINLIEYMRIYDEKNKLIQENSQLELRIRWKDTIEFEVVTPPFPH